jgi:hypothetical protein
MERAAHLFARDEGDPLPALHRLLRSVASAAGTPL